MESSLPTSPSLGQIILRNTVLVSAGGGVIRLLDYLFTLYSVRLLGEQQYGQYATILALVGIGGVFCELGLSQYVERTVAQDPARAQSLFGNLVALRLILALAGSLLITAVTFGLGYDPLIVLGVLLQTGGFVLAAFSVPLQTILRANERFAPLVLMDMATQVAALATGVTLLHLGFGPLALVISGLVRLPIEMILALRALRYYKLGPLSWRIRPAEWAGFIRAALPFGLTTLALTLNFSADSLILSLFHPATQVGLYYAAYRLVFTLIALADGFLDVVTPSLAREHGNNPEQVAEYARGTLSWMLLFGLPAALGVSLLAPQLVQLLYGPQYAESAALLALIGWDIPLLLITAFCGNLTAASGLERPAALVYWLGASTNLLLNLLVIPQFGALGATLVTLASDGITLFAFAVLLSRRLALQRLLLPLLKIGVAVLLMGMLVWILRDWPLVVPVVAGALLYALLAFGLKLIDLREVLRLLRPVTGKGGDE